jgi:hypothetical protein
VVGVAATAAAMTTSAAPPDRCGGWTAGCARDRTPPPGPSAGRLGSGPRGERAAGLSHGRMCAGPAATTLRRRRRAGRTRRPDRGCPDRPVLSYREMTD